MNTLTLLMSPLIKMRFIILIGGIGKHTVEREDNC